jgi:hypothetical protein
LISDEPRTANNLITSIVSAIVRNHIANSTIDEIIKNRDQIRKLILDTLMPLTRGWGIWLETVEITDVQILSVQLKRDLQCVFREDQNLQATSNRIEVDHEIKAKQQEQYNVQNKREQDTYETKTVDDSSRGIVRKDQEFTKTQKNNTTAYRKYKIAQDERDQQNNRTVKLREQEYHEEYNSAEQRTKLEVNEKAKVKEYNKIKDQEEITQLEKNQALQTKTKQQQLDFKQQDFDLIREKMKDKNYVQEMKQNVVTAVYQNIDNNSEFNFQTSDGKDCVIGTIDSLMDTMVGKTPQPKK